MLSSFSFTDVQHESLVGGDIPRIVADGDRGFEHASHFPIFTTHIEFEVRDVAMFMQQSFQPLAVRSVYVKRTGDVDVEQFFAGIVTGHSKQRVVEIQEAPLRSGNEYPFLYVRDQSAIFFFCALAVGNVLKNMDGAQWISRGVGEGGI